MLTQGLVIDEPWIGLILAGHKTWEMRSRATNKRGPIALIRKGSGQVVGTAILIDSLPPLEEADMAAAFDNHRIPQAMVRQDGYNWLTPWVLDRVRPLSRPVSYQHPSGAVTWVNLESDVQALLNYGNSPTALRRPHVAALPTIHAAIQQPPIASIENPLPGRRIPISDGNVKNGHFSVRLVADLLPADAIGGGNKAAAGRPLEVSFMPGPRVETDIAGDKMILRDRSGARTFFAQTGARGGDSLLFRKINDRHFEVSLVPRAL